MSPDTMVSLLRELLYLIIVFDLFLMIGIISGRQTLINIITSLYLAFLLFMQFPYKSSIGDGTLPKLAFFVIISVLMYFLVKRIMPDQFQENKLEGVGKKILLSFGATILVTIFAIQSLGLGEFLTFGSPAEAIFAPAHLFFWWLVAPLTFLFIVS